MNFRDWIDTPEAWFMTAQEREQWKQATSFPAAQKFVAEYETRRGPAFRQWIRDRVAFADKHFSTTSIQGSQTPKGRVWIILGSPNVERSDHGAPTAGSPGPLGAIEANAFLRTQWFYKSDRLPKELGVPNLTVIFQTDKQRGYETIENPGLVEPYLVRAAAFVGERMLAEAARMSTPAANPLWQLPEELHGVSVTGGAFISPTDKPFLAVDFYIPKSAAAFNGIDKVVVAAALKDSNGAEVSTPGVTLPLHAYDATGDRYVDRSFPLDAGKYTAALALYGPDGTTLLTKTQREFEVAPADAAGISPVMLSSHVETLQKQEAFDPFTFVATKYAIRGDGRFRGSDTITAFTIISSHATRPQMTMSMTVLKDGGKFDKTPPDPVPLTQTGPHTYLVAVQFPAKAFPPGHYSLQLDFNDTNAAKKYTTKGEFDVVP
jgi:GWxTD domain-containing protein